MNARHLSIMTIVVAICCLLAIPELKKVFQGAPLLLLLVIPMLKILLSKSTCPHCDTPVHGMAKIYDSVLSGSCEKCANER